MIHYKMSNENMYDSSWYGIRSQLVNMCMYKRKKRADISQSVYHYTSKTYTSVALSLHLFDIKLLTRLVLLVFSVSSFWKTWFASLNVLFLSWGNFKAKKWETCSGLCNHFQSQLQVLSTILKFKGYNHLSSILKTLNRW